MCYNKIAIVYPLAKEVEIEGLKAAADANSSRLADLELSLAVSRPFHADDFPNKYVQFSLFLDLLQF